MTDKGIIKVDMLLSRASRDARRFAKDIADRMRIHKEEFMHGAFVETKKERFGEAYIIGRKDKIFNISFDYLTLELKDIPETGQCFISLTPLDIRILPIVRYLLSEQEYGFNQIEVNSAPNVLEHPTTFSRRQRWVMN